jgi:hypothetical protein
MAEEGKERRRGVVEPLHAPRPHASLPAIGGAPTPTSSSAAAARLHHAASVHRRAPRWQRNRRYMPLEECEQLWETNESVDHPDVGLPHGWCQGANPAVPEAGPKLDAEIRRLIRNLPESMRCDRMYQKPQLWYDFLSWEHTTRRRSTFHGEYQPWEAYPNEESPSPRCGRHRRRRYGQQGCRRGHEGRRPTRRQ